MLRSIMTVSGFTAVSRVLGFLRDILIAKYVGSGLVGDAFLSAFRFPNLFRRIFGEGAFNAAFVPMFGRRLEGDGEEKAMGFASNAFSALALVLVVLSLIAIPTMKWVMGAVVPGFKPAEELVVDGRGVKEFSVAISGERNVYFADGISEREGDGRRMVLRDVRLVKEGEKVWTKPFSQGDRMKEVDLDGFAAIYREWSEERAERLDDGTLAKDALVNMTREGGDWVIEPGDFGRVRLMQGHDYGWIEGKLVMEGTRADLVQIYRNHPWTFALTVTLSQITFCYLLFMALTAHLSGVLNTFKVFAAPAAAPILLNLVFLVGLVVFVSWLGSDLPGHVLAWCVAIAGFLQMGMLWLTCWRKGYRVRLQRPKFDGELKRLVFLMGPGIAAAGIQQVNLLVGSVIASFQQGAISWLYYSDRVYQLPLGMIGIALGIVLLPEVTRLLRSGNEREASDSIVRGAELGLLITLPAAVAMLVMPESIMSLLFERGEFTRTDTLATSRALMGFALGLPGYVMIKVLQPGYFAREDTKTPMKMAGWTVLTNIVVSLALFPSLGHVGIAIATTVAAWVNVWLLWRGLKDFVAVDEMFWRKVGKMVWACGMMAVGLWLAQWMLGGWTMGELWQKVISVGLLVGLGMSIYVMAVLGLGATSLAEIRAGFRK